MKMSGSIVSRGAVKDEQSPPTFSLSDSWVKKGEE